MISWSKKFIFDSTYKRYLQIEQYPDIIRESEIYNSFDFILLDKTQTIKRFIDHESVGAHESWTNNKFNTNK